MASTACKYFQHGICSKKNCTKSHSLEHFDLPLCKYYKEKGWCRFGVNCRLIHGNKCESCEKYILHPFNSQWAQSHRKKCGSTQEDDNCGICLKSLYKNKDDKDDKDDYGDDIRLAVFEVCKHVFCFKCIKAWKSAHRSLGCKCPICRRRSRFVVPINRMENKSMDKKELERVVELYKNNCSKIVCKNYSRGCHILESEDGDKKVKKYTQVAQTCKFNADCAYYHPTKCVEYPNGRIRLYGDQRNPSETYGIWG